MRCVEMIALVQVGVLSYPLSVNEFMWLVELPFEVDRSPPSTLYSLAQSLVVVAECERRAKPHLVETVTPDAGTIVLPLESTKPHLVVSTNTHHLALPTALQTHTPIEALIEKPVSPAYVSIPHSSRSGNA